MRGARAAVALAALVVVAPLAGCLDLVDPRSECFALRSERPDCSSVFLGVRAVAGFEGAFDAPRARLALESMDFTIAEESATRVRTAPRDGLAFEARAANASSSTWSLVAEYRVDAKSGLTREEARARGEDLWRDRREAILADLAAFEAKTGSRHVGDVRWEPLVGIA